MVKCTALTVYNSAAKVTPCLQHDWKLPPYTKFGSPCRGSTPKEHAQEKSECIFSHCTSQTYLAKNRSVQPTSLFLVSNLFQVPTKADWTKIAGDFTRRWQFPNCLGAVDGKHVAITCPPKSGSTFFNSKVSHSGHLCAFLLFFTLSIGRILKRGAVTREG